MAAAGELQFEAGEGRKHAGLAVGVRQSAATSPATAGYTGKPDRRVAALPRWVALLSSVAGVGKNFIDFFHCKFY